MQREMQQSPNICIVLLALAYKRSKQGWTRWHPGILENIPKQSASLVHSQMRQDQQGQWKAPRQASCNQNHHNLWTHENSLLGQGLHIDFENGGWGPSQSYISFWAWIRLNTIQSYISYIIKYSLLKKVGDHGLPAPQIGIFASRAKFSWQSNFTLDTQPFTILSRTKFHVQATCSHVISKPRNKSPVRYWKFLIWPPPCGAAPVAYDFTK